jgi:hypothetical protein
VATFGLGPGVQGLGGLEGGVGALGAFHRHRRTAHQAFVAGVVVPRAAHLGGGGIDAGAGLADHRVLPLFGGVKVGQQGLLGGYRTFGLGQACTVIPVVEANQQVAGLDLLVVADQHLVDVPGHLGPDHRHLGADVGIVRGFDKASVAPPIGHVQRQCHQGGQAQGQYQQAFAALGGVGRGDGKVGGGVGRREAGHGGYPREDVITIVI